MTILIAFLSALGASGILVFVQFLINRHDKKKEAANAKDSEDAKQTEMLKRIDDRTNTLIIDTQSLKLDALISNHPDNVSDIMLAAHRYFVELNGDSWMKKVFEDYLDSYEIPHPEYLKDVA